MSRDSKDFPAAFPSLSNTPGVVCRNASLSATGRLADRHKTRGRRETLAGFLAASGFTDRRAAGSASEPEAGVGQTSGSAKGRAA
jgi:hypothetical protein